MTTGQRMKSLRKALGISADEIAEKLEVSRSTIFRYEKGDIEKIPSDIIKPLAKILMTTTDYLMGLTNDPYNYEADPQNRRSTVPEAHYQALAQQHNGDAAKILKAYADMPQEEKEQFNQVLATAPLQTSQKNVRRIPILGHIAAGLPIYADQHIEGYTYTDLNGSNEYFALRVHGDSMNAMRIDDGDILIIKRQPVAENGEIVVVLVDGESATVKQFYQNKDTVTLVPKSTNPEHQIQIYDLKSTTIQVLGKVVRNQIEF